MEISVRSYLTAGVALTAASAIALTPVVVSPGGVHSLPVPHVSASQVHLTAAINPADVAALVGNLNAAMGSVTSTVSSLVDASGQSLADALNSAAGLNNTLWDGLIRAAGSNATLASVMIALKAASAGGLSQLAASVDDAGGTIALSSGQVAGLLTSTVTGSLGSAMQAVTSIVNDPLSAASYLGLLTTPFGIAGMALQGGINAVATLATGGVALASTLVTGVTAQIDNALSLVNGVLDSGKSLTDIALIDGALTAVQGIVSAPVAAALAGANGITGAVADVATFALGAVAGGASGVVSTWLGDGSSAGALERAIVAIGTAPLSPASYTEAIGVLVGAGFSTVKTVAGTVSSFASLPFRVGADLTTTGAEVITSFTNGLADAASGLLHAAGLSPFVSGLPRALATAISGAVKVAAFATSAALNTIAAAIDFGQAVGGIFDARTSALAATGPAALPTAGLRRVLVDTSAERDGSDGATALDALATPESTPSNALEESAAPAAESAAAPATDVDPATIDTPSPEALDSADKTGKDVSPAAGTEEGTSPAPSTAAEAVDGRDGEAVTPTDVTAKDGADPDSAPEAGVGARKGGTAKQSHSATVRLARSDTQTAPSAGADDSDPESYGRHASGATASESPSAAGRHRADSPSTSTPSRSGEAGESSSHSTSGAQAAA